VSSQSPSPRSTLLGVSGITGSGTLGLRWADAPWWAVWLFVVLVLVIGAVLVIAPVVIPQESQDKLAWWELWRARRRPNQRPPRHRRRYARN
jgi:hypothetical protein